MARTRRSIQTPHTCSICGRPSEDAKHMLAAGDVAVCDSCVSLMHEEMQEMLSKDSKNIDIVEGRSTPSEIVKKLDEYIIGQQEAKETIALAVYNHYKRLDGNPEVELTKSNILMMGPSGTGKTLIVQSIAKQLDVPCVIADVSQLTAAGYIGDDVDSVVQNLLAAAEGDVEKAQRGIIILDECFPPEVEIYTRNGFRRFDELKPGEDVLQYNNDGSFKFVEPIRNIEKDFDGSLYHIYNSDFDHISTPSHNRIVGPTSTSYSKVQAQATLNPEFFFPTAGILSLNTAHYSALEMHCYAMYVLYGSHKDGNITFKIPHEAFKNELTTILDKMDVIYVSNADDDIVVFFDQFGSKYENFESLVRGEKLDRTVMIGLPVHLRRILLSYIFHYSVRRRPGAVAFKDYAVAEMYVELSHLTGYDTAVYQGNDQEILVYVKGESFKKQSEVCEKWIPYKGKVYCVEVPSNMILIRCNGAIQISGNCDKARKQSPGRSLTKDVGGEAVQQGLLKMMEGTEIRVAKSGRKTSSSQTDIINTKDILFVCCGAFVHLDEIIAKRKQKNKPNSIGFGASFSDKDEKRNPLKDVEVEDLYEYGMIPEFMGRLPVICALDELTKDDMVHILTQPKNAVVKQFQELVRLDGSTLEFTDEALEEIAEEALKNKTGARGLRSILEKRLRPILFKLPDEKPGQKIVIDAQKSKENGSE